MRIPKKIDILGHPYKVTQQKRFQSDNSKFVAYGKHNYYRKTIKIRKSLTHSQKEQSFLHEIIHAVDSRNKGNLSEKQVEYLSRDLYAVFKINKMLK